MDFLYSLALELRMTVGQLRREMTTREYVEWSVFFKRRDAQAKRRNEDAEDLATARKLAASMGRG